MCGIALIISGVRIDLSSLLPDYTPPPPSKDDQVVFSVHDLEAALQRRGPDSLGSRKVFLHSRISSSVEDQDIFSIMEGGDEIKGNGSCLQCCRNKFDCLYSANGESCWLQNSFDVRKCVPELHFIGATLQLRGTDPIIQPLVDACGNILIYNGEIFGGIHVDFSRNDAEILMQSLGKCCSCDSDGHTKACHGTTGNQNSVPELLSTIKGPWAVVYWQDSSRTLWFGRDAFGRRSLLVHWPTLEDSRLLLSSVSPPCSVQSEGKNEMSDLNFWEELTCGVYSMHVGFSKLDGFLAGRLKRHEWTSSVLKVLVKWERTSVVPKPQELQFSRIVFPGLQHGPMIASASAPAQRVLTALRESVMRRSTQNTNFQAAACNIRREEHVPVAVLFSGGLDSMIIAALLDECLESSCAIDLLNVSFDGQSAPDRISAKAGINELRRIAPLRRWKLVEIDADLLELTTETKHVMSLITPAKTYMDINIGIALWLAAGGDGWVAEGISNDYKVHQCVKYRSEARILLVGSGADEQCAGYGRHKTKYRLGSWLGLHEEMKLDMQRIWKRNLGRDDRCISDNGKEARFPFLDEDVIRILLDVPLWNVADLDQPSGKGDKKILREVAQLLGLYEAAVMPKRAIQFGSRIARESNRKNFGSNRAANQASAGSAVIHRSLT
ncbi:uncharacterized protein LOC131154429 isoform X2 [Malania oleifera]|uniref:uncharacterized protein LOC131154429 isoform X2 n=1 Tax=Malania oleifera TaxID=397392 RepID=UPI0025AE3256|nr:uncharacterized protein LOC131154429 isoform X2 [Malania oleifera]